MAKITSLKKPMPVNKAALMAFVEGDRSLQSDAPKGTPSARTAPSGQRSGQIPTGDVRLTANIQEDLHLKLKIRAATERTTVGELIERWIKSW